MISLTTQVERDVAAWLGRAVTLFANERHQQVELASFLRLSGHYDEVILEYFVPNGELKPDYVWDSELRLDIVVRLGAEYVPIELKYKTKAVAGPITRFGEDLGEKEYTLVKSHSAQDLGMYDFWKDVRRLELVKRRFAGVAGGVALFMTNDSYYRRGPKSGSICAKFSMTAGPHGRDRSWLRDTAATKGRPSFTLDAQYTLSWSTCRLGHIDFDYTIVTI